MDLAGPLALAGLILVKEAGLPVPVPGDLLVLGAGVAAARGDVPALPTILVIVLASVLGGGVQFWLIRGRGRRVVVSLLERFGVPRERLDTQTTRLRGAGARGVALARMT